MTVLAPTYHVPVLLRQSVDALGLRAGGVYADMTFGGGGHSREILARLDGGHLYGFDQDADAERNVPAGDERFTFVRSNFRYLANWMRYYGEEAVDGILADLGVSSHHFDDERRGFSFRFEAPLDMRMNRRAGMTAADVVNRYDEERLARIFYLYGELKNSRRLAATLVRARAAAPVTTVAQLVALMQPLLGPDRQKKEMAKIFQALRIEVNHEMEALEEMLHAAVSVLRPGGRLVVLTYHSCVPATPKARWSRTSSATASRRSGRSTTRSSCPTNRSRPTIPAAAAPSCAWPRRWPDADGGPKTAK